tara:strand:- start:13579 stop:14307 length:729 start_codon:yes stop_codon:yes gene_type:complete
MIYNPLSPTKWTQHPNAMVCWGGGGDKTTTTTIPKEFMPYLTTQLEKMQSLDDEGKVGQVADITPEMQEALDMKEKAVADGNILTGKAEEAMSIYEDQKNQTGIFGSDQYDVVQNQIKEQISREQKGRMGGLSTDAAMSGGLGSARGEMMREGAMGNIAYDKTNAAWDKQKSEALGGAGSFIGSHKGITDSYLSNADALGDVGSYGMDYNQKVLDKDFDAAQKMFSLYGQTGKHSETIGGGK